MSKTVLITGASGFVGSNLWRYMETLGHPVYGLGRRLMPRDNYVQHDLSHALRLDLRPDVVIHAAALSSPWGSKKEFWQHNVNASEHILDFCKAVGYPKLVFISSSSVYYEQAHQLDIDEQTPLPKRAINHYAASKRAAEKRIQAYPGDWVILRPRAVFGPEDSVIFPRLLAAARAGRLPLLHSKQTVMGDLIYIDNLVDYISQASLRPELRGCYNLTNNQPVPILELVLELLAGLDIPAPKRLVPVQHAMRAAGVLEAFHHAFMPQREPAITRYGISVFAYSKTFAVAKMVAAMGEPKISIEEGLDRFIRWVKTTGAA